MCHTERVVSLVMELRRQAYRMQAVAASLSLVHYVFTAVPWLCFAITTPKYCKKSHLCPEEWFAAALRGHRPLYRHILW
jgi:hypothetical protein